MERGGGEAKALQAEGALYEASSGRPRTGAKTGRNEGVARAASVAGIVEAQYKVSVGGRRRAESGHIMPRRSVSGGASLKGGEMVEKGRRQRCASRGIQQMRPPGDNDGGLFLACSSRDCRGVRRLCCPPLFVSWPSDCISAPSVRPCKRWSCDDRLTHTSKSRIESGGVEEPLQAALRTPAEYATPLGGTAAAVLP